MRKDIRYTCGSAMFSSEMIAIFKIFMNYWFNSSHLGFYSKTRHSRRRIRVGFFCAFSYSPTGSNYVEKHLLTFISIKYLGLFHLKMKIIHIFRSNYLTLTLFVTSVDLL